MVKFETIFVVLFTTIYNFDDGLVIIYTVGNVGIVVGIVVGSFIVWFEVGCAVDWFRVIVVVVVVVVVVSLIVFDVFCTVTKGYGYIFNYVGFCYMTTFVYVIFLGRVVVDLL